MKTKLNELRTLQWAILLGFTVYVACSDVNKIEGYLLVIVFLLIDKFELTVKGDIDYEDKLK